MILHERKLVSIILPTFNGSRFLEQSIISCIRQTYKNWELIIVDDASMDQTPEIIKKYINLDYRIKTLRNSSNRKLPYSLNKGFKASQGVFFTWTSDANCFKPDAIESLVNFLESNQEVAIVYSDYVLVDEENNKLGYVTANIPDRLTTGNVVSASFLYRRKVHDKIGGFDENLFLIEDYEFWLLASLSFKLMPLHKSLYYYRMHNSSLTSKNKEVLHSMREKLLSRYLPKMKWAKDSYRAEGYLLLAKLAKHRNDRRRILYYLIHTLRCRPSLCNFIKVFLFAMDSFLSRKRYFSSSRIFNA